MGPTRRASSPPRGISRMTSDGSETPTSARGSKLSRLTSPLSGSNADVTDVTAVRSIIEELFFAWLVQQDISEMPAEALFREFDFYGIERPNVQCSFHQLREWYNTKGVPTSFTSVPRPAAQRQAQHLALIFELPEYWPRGKVEYEEFLELASGIIAHPQTFNERVRSRLRTLLERGLSDEDLWNDGIQSLACDMGEAQVKLFLRASANPADAGRMSPLMVSTLRDRVSPWLVGNESRFSSPVPSLPEGRQTPRRPHSRA